MKDIQAILERLKKSRFEFPESPRTPDRRALGCGPPQPTATGGPGSAADFVDGVGARLSPEAWEQLKRRVLEEGASS